MLANRILGIITTILAWPTLPLQLVTTFVGGCLISLTFGLLLIPLSIVWTMLFLRPLMGLSWLWDKTPILRVPLAVVGVPLAAIGSTYVALIPSMGEMESRVTKLVFCETWPFSLDYHRSLQGIEITDEARLERIKQVMWRMRVGPLPDDANENIAWVLDNTDDGVFVGSGILRLVRPLHSANHMMAELRPAGPDSMLYQLMHGPNRKLTIQAYADYDLEHPAFEFPLTEYRVESGVIRFNIEDSAVTFHPIDASVLRRAASPQD